jgi:divinyl protochlorophyllide a 8-vinyl-reductase
MKTAGLVGPNAVIQLAAALAEYPDLARAVFARAGLAHMLATPPNEMIDQSIPAALFDALYAELPRAQAGQVAYRAGWLTGQYILAHRIPRPAQALLRLLPARWGAALLLRAILRHAWTFAGTGVCAIGHSAGALGHITLRDNPMPMQDSLWHQGVFAALFRALISPRVQVQHQSLGPRDDLFTLILVPRHLAQHRAAPTRAQQHGQDQRQRRHGQQAGR